MEDNKIDKNALTEAYTILTELELYNKIPNELQEYIYVNKNNEYKFSFNKKEPLFYQVTNKTTKVLLSYLYTQYIGNDSKNKSFILNDVIELLKNID